MMGRNGYYPPWVTVLVGMGMMWENLTHGILVWKPSQNEDHQRHHHAVDVGSSVMGASVTKLMLDSKL